MKRKSYSGRVGEIVKTSITMPKVLAEFAEGKMKSRGFPTFSSYLVRLLQDAMEREERSLARQVRATQDLETVRVFNSPRGSAAGGSADKPATAAPGLRAAAPKAQDSHRSIPGLSSGHRGPEKPGR